MTASGFFGVDWERFWRRPPGASNAAALSNEARDERAMPLTAHLGELRRRLLISLGALGASIGVAFWQAPALIRALKALTGPDVTFVQLTPGEALMASVKIAVTAGVALASPVILYQALRFASPGLRRRERRLALLAVWWGAGLFAAGVTFSYYCALPPALTFLLGYGREIAVSQLSVLRFVEFCLSTLTLCGLAFECPLILVALSLLGLVRSSQLLARWREATAVIFFLAAALTPSQDPLTMLLVALALMALYALSLAPMRLMGR